MTPIYEALVAETGINPCADAARRHYSDPRRRWLIDEVLARPFMRLDVPTLVRPVTA